MPVLPLTVPRTIRLAGTAVAAVVAMCLALCLALSSDLGAQEPAPEPRPVPLAESASVGNLPVSFGQRDAGGVEAWSSAGPVVPLMAVMSGCLLVAGAALLWRRCQPGAVGPRGDGSG